MWTSWAGFADSLSGVPGYLWAAVGILASIYGALIIDLATAYPEGWDALSYHLPLSVTWFQERTVAVDLQKHWMLSLPGNSEVVSFLVLPAGWEALLPLPQSIGLTCLLIGVYSLALRLSRDRTAAVSCVFITLTLPIVYFQTASAYVDLFGTGFLFAAAALGLHGVSSGATAEGRLGLVAAAALACGIAVGVKPTFWLYATLLTAAMGLAALRQTGWNLRSVVRPTVIFGVGMLVPSVFWFARAAHGTGNLLYPLEVTWGDRVLLPGFASTEITPIDFAIGRFVRSELEWLVYPWVEYKHPLGLTAYSAEAGLGAAFATFVPLGLAYLAWRTYTAKANCRAALLCWWGLFAAMALCWLLLLRQTPRFGLPWIVFCVVLSAPFLAVIARGGRRSFQILFVAAIAGSSALLGLDPALSLAVRLRFQTWTRAAHYNYPQALDQLPPGTVVLNLAGYNNYAVAGRRLSNRIVNRFEAPRPLTFDFLANRGVDIVVDLESKPDPPVEGLTLMRREAVSEPSTGQRTVWRIWRVNKT